jgi:hypothetical protein
MRAQSAVEFLMTYSFVFIIIAAAILIVFLLVAVTRTELKSECVSFSSVDCNFVSFYSPTGPYYSVLTFSITNSQDAPMNVTNTIVSFRSTNFVGICVPNFLYQDQEATCIANITSRVTEGSPVQGFYTINAQFCNSPVVSPISNCTSNASYEGSFYTYSEPVPVPIFSVIAAIGNGTTQLPAYRSVPLLPDSYSVVNNGDWVGKQNKTSIAYALGTTGYGGNYFGINVAPYPSSLYYLNNNAVACSPNYNSTISFAYTGIYLNKSTSLNFSNYAVNAIAVWYLPQGSNIWNSVYGSTLWPTGTARLNFQSETLGPGLEGIAVEWADTCGAGFQSLKLSGNVLS